MSRDSKTAKGSYTIKMCRGRLQLDKEAMPQYQVSKWKANLYKGLLRTSTRICFLMERVCVLCTGVPPQRRPGRLPGQRGGPAEETRGL